jgi:hypothetical protein
MRTLGWIFYAQAGMPNKRLGQSKPVWRALNEGEAPGPNWTMTRELPIPCKCLKELAGTTGLEPAASAVTGQRSNQLNYVPTLFSYRYWKPACLLAFLTFNRFACVAHCNRIGPNSEVNGHHGHQAKPPSKTAMQANTNPEQLSLPRERIVAERRLIRQALTRMRVGVLGRGVLLVEHS